MKALADCDHVEGGDVSACDSARTTDANTKLSLQAEDLHYTDEEAKQVKRKIDLIVLPLLCGCYIFSVSQQQKFSLRADHQQFLDKTLLNYSSIFGLKQALKLKGADYSWLGRQVAHSVSPTNHTLIRTHSIFYLGYMIGSMIWAKLVQRFPLHAGKLIATAVLLWSSIVLLTRQNLLPYRHDPWLTKIQPFAPTLAASWQHGSSSGS